jgi:hypothetical protein
MFALALLAGCGDAAQTVPTTDSGSSTPSQSASREASTYGHPASQPDRRAIIELVQGYYAAAVADDGAAACERLYSVLEEAVPEDYGQPPAASYLRGKTCSTVMSKLFAHLPDRRSGALTKTTITGVRLYDKRALVQLSSPSMPTGDLLVRREHHVWKVETLIGEPCSRCAGTEAHTAIYKGSTSGVTKMQSGATPDVSRPSFFSGPRHPDAQDGDDDPGSLDDDPILNYGHTASKPDRLAITALIFGYYRAAASGDGKAGCSLLYSLIAETLSEDYGQSVDAVSPTCSATLSVLFEKEHHRLVADAHMMKVDSVRVDGSRAYVLLNLGRASQRYTVVHRDGGAWRVEQTFDVNLP